MPNISVCGIDCDACKFDCAGCRTVAPEGKCVWGGRCETHNCCAGQGLPHCGKCKDFPCQRLIAIHQSENPDGNGIEIETLRKMSET